ncbi:MAG: hypothetical protein HY234_01755 [Acidobacteria bacterium]|nr:hypothetical protein [Acidobacteriota bacterium]MBI3661763.1 hypothetical protein [Acidobacteriota bacterium]
MKLCCANSEGTARGPLRIAVVAFALAVCLAALAPPAAAQGQAFKMQGGSSTLFGGHGGSVEIRGDKYTGRVGFGLLNGKPRYGIYFAASWRNVLWGAGDQAISFTLPTDIFNHSYYFLGRGVSASWKNGRDSIFIYGGATSLGFTTPFLNLAEADRKTALIFYERKLTPSLRFFSRNVLAARQTSLQSLEWAPSERIKLAVTGGIGNNQRYWAGSFDLDKDWIEVQASYSRAGDAFRRIRVEAPISTETDRENIRIALKPLRNLQFTVSRQNYLAPLHSGVSTERASVNSYSAWTTLRGFQFHGSLFDSTTQSGRSKGLTIGGRRNWWNRVETGVDYLRSTPSLGPAFHTVVGTLREHITPRISLSQVVTTGNGQTYVSFGGNFLSNRLSAGVEYQTIFLPFNTSGRSQFKQVIAASARLRLWNGIEVNGASDVTPLGKVRFTVYATGFAYRGVSYGRGSAPASGAIYSYVVRGRVLEEGGQPVRGAAVKIDGELVFSDSQGSFFLRRKKQKECELSVALDQFILPGNYQVVSAPKTVKAAREEMAEMYEVVLKRLKNVAPPVSEERNPKQVFGSGTNVQSGTVPDVPILPLRPSPSTRSKILMMAPRMPIESPRGTPSGVGSFTKSKAYPVSWPGVAARRSNAAGARATRPAERKSRRDAGRADSGKRSRRVERSARSGNRVGKRVAGQHRRAGKYVALGAGSHRDRRRPS